MALIPIDEAQAGMILEQDVKDRQARLLVRAGVELTDQHVASLKVWGVTMVAVQNDGHADEGEALPDDAATRERLEKVEAFFGTAKVQHEFLSALRDAVLFATARGGSGW